MPRQQAERGERSSDLARRYQGVRSRTQRLCLPLEPDDFGAQSMPDASPAKWHLAHTTWFFETFVLRELDFEHRPYGEGWGFLFNSYYNAEGPRQERGGRGRQTRPTLAQVRAYRQAIDERMASALAGLTIDDELLDIVELGLHHEEQHQELLLTDVQHLFGHNALETRYAAAAPPASRAIEMSWRKHLGGLCAIGHSDEAFCFDNERPAHQVYLEPFELASALVTNGGYAAFIEDAGYRRAELWLSDGWTRVLEGRWQAPLYWRRGADGWSRFSLHGLEKLDPNAPVSHVSYYEADAYARWAGARLPREAEWEVAVQTVDDGAQFLDERVFVPLATDSPAGSAWVWTASPYVPYPGYRPARGALGEYNGKFMSNQIVLRGGSCFTPPGHVRASYRNFFYPDARWQVTGIRLAR